MSQARGLWRSPESAPLLFTSGGVAKGCGRWVISHGPKGDENIKPQEGDRQPLKQPGKKHIGEGHAQEMAWTLTNTSSKMQSASPTPSSWEGSPGPQEEAKA